MTILQQDRLSKMRQLEIVMAEIVKKQARVEQDGDQWNILEEIWEDYYKQWEPLKQAYEAEQQRNFESREKLATKLDNDLEQLKKEGKLDQNVKSLTSLLLRAGY